MNISGSVDQDLWCTVTISNIDYYGYLRGWAGNSSRTKTIALNNFGYVQPYSGSYEFSFDVSSYQGQTIIIRAALYDASTYAGTPTYDAEDTLYISSGGGGGYDPGEDDEEIINIDCTIGTGTIDCTVELTGFSTVHHAAVVLYRDSYSHTSPSNTPNSSQNIYNDFGTVTFTNLPTDNYRIWVYVYTTASGSYIASEAYPSATRWMSVTAASAPAYWSWTASTARRKAQTALNNKGAVSDFSYTVWNELCEKVLEIRQALGSGWNSYYLTFAKTKMTASDKTLTAARYNSLRYNVGVSYSTGIGEVSSGDIVKGQIHFLNLTDKINEWIDYAF